MIEDAISRVRIGFGSRRSCRLPFGVCYLGGRLRAEIQSLWDRLNKQTRYSIALQRAIEAHSRGQQVPEGEARHCPHHAAILDALRRAPTPPLTAQLPLETRTHP